MMRLSRSVFTIVTLLSFGYSTNAKVLMAHKDGIKDVYIVCMKPNYARGPEAVLEQVAPWTTNSIMIDSSTRIYSTFNCFSAKLPFKEAEKLSELEDVLRVEQDAKVSIAEFTDRWGLDRIDQEEGLNTDYTPPKNGGKGVTAYIMDTGIMYEHKDFGGRARFGAEFNNVKEGEGDGNGHGTHCAGIVGGKFSGVAKAVELVDVKILNSDGYGSWTGVINGMNWIRTNHNFTEGPGTVNMSLGGPINLSVNAAVKNLVEAGISVVVAAGNENDNACNYSPASTEEAITVGSTTSDDMRSSFSNHGADCMNIYAPGSYILSAYMDGGYTELSGTSMASPHVCGVAALLLGNNNILTPAEVKQELSDRAVKGKVKNAKKAPNELLQIGEYFPPEPTRSPIPTTSPTSSPSLEPSRSAAPSAKCVNFEFEVKLDIYPSELSWEVVSTDNNEVLASRYADYYEKIGSGKYDKVTECIVPECMKLYVYDWYGDGIIDPGYFRASYAGDMLVEKTSGEQWHEVITPEFGCITPSPTTDEPSVAPSTACGQDEFQFKIGFHADNNSHEQNTYFVKQLTKKGDRKKILTMPNSDIGRFTAGELSEKSVCLKKRKCYVFVVRDKGQDGICCQNGMGYYQLEADGMILNRSIFSSGTKEKYIFSDPVNGIESCCCKSVHWDSDL